MALMSKTFLKVAQNLQSLKIEADGASDEAKSAGKPKRGLGSSDAKCLKTPEEVNYYIPARSAKSGTR